MQNPLYQEESNNLNYQKHNAIIEEASTHNQVSHPGFATKCVHAGQEPEKVHGSVNTPIHLSSTFILKTPTQLYNKSLYTRWGNPTSDTLDSLLSSLEYGSHTRTFSSGCGATTTMFSLWKQGDHILVFDDVYGGTNSLVNNIFKQRFGFEVDFIDMTDLEIVKKSIKENTKMIWMESPSNPTIKLVDIEGICNIAKAQDHKIVTVVDNTFATPFNQNPLKLGADAAYNSLTKYIGGHSDIVAGAITVRDADLYERIHYASKNIGTNISPFDSYMIIRGAKTLAVRMKQHNINSMAVARFLESHPQVAKVRHPGLESHPQHELAKKQMRVIFSLKFF